MASAIGMPYFSIIIPAYNEEKYIEKALQSIKSQTMQDYEVIVVANGCTDKTEEVVNQNITPKIRYLSLPKPKVSVARNAGALNAQGSLLLFLDADTQLPPEALQHITENFTEKYAIATTKAKPDTGKWKHSMALSFKNLYNQTIYQGCSGALICRKQDFRSVGGYAPDLEVREHRQLIKKLLQKGKYTVMDTLVITSMRRYQQWGLAKAAWFWVVQWWKEKFNDVSKSEYEKVR